MFGHILVPMDSSALCECVLPHLVTIAQTFGSRCTLLQVLESGATTNRRELFDPVIWLTNRISAEQYLESVAKRLRDEGLDAQFALLEGKTSERILEFANQHQADLIMLASHGKGQARAWCMGSVATKTIQRSRVSTMIVRADKSLPGGWDAERYCKVLVPLDRSQRAEAVLPLAAALVQICQGELLLAHVLPGVETPFQASLQSGWSEASEFLVDRNRQDADFYLNDLCARLPVPSCPRLLEGGQVFMTLQEMIASESVDLVVINAHGYSGISGRRYGAVAMNFIHNSNTPLFIYQDSSADRLLETFAELTTIERQGH